MPSNQKSDRQSVSEGGENILLLQCCQTLPAILSYKDSIRVQTLGR
jgi:hypothetical protein